MIPSPASLDFGTQEMDRQIQLTAYGPRTIEWTAKAAAYANWIAAIEPASGQLKNGDRASLTVYVERAALADGARFCTQCGAKVG